MTKSRKYIGFILVVVYTFFFVSNNFFYHTHHLATIRLVHSHPFGGQNHSHTANQILLIDNINSAIYHESSDVIIPDTASDLLCCGKIQLSQEVVQSSYVLLFSLKAPPARS